MDTKTGKILQVVDTEPQKATLEAAAAIAQEVLTEAEVKLENAKREAAGEGKIEKIARQPKKNCRHCYGRGHLGKNILTGLYVSCYCVEDPDHKKARIWQEHLRRFTAPKFP
jgi:hypothetical protein